MPRLDKAVADLAALENSQAAAQAKLLATDSSGLTVNQLSLLIITHKLDNAKLDYLRKITEYQQRMEDIQSYNMVLQLITHHATDEGLTVKSVDGKTDHADLRALLETLKEKGCPLTIKDKYDAKERDALVENLKRGMDSLSYKNNITLEAITQTGNERLEAYQYARFIMKSAHDTGTQISRNISK